jgi:hypothetical protein
MTPATRPGEPFLSLDYLYTPSATSRSDRGPESA